GEGRPDESVFAVFVLGVIVMRSAGCVVNDLADRRFDPHVKRTRDRPLALGTVSVAEALCLFAGLMLIAFGLVLTQNRLTITLAFVGAFLAATYPFMKRFTSLPQLYLGVAFGWGVPMAFAAQTAALPQISWLMFLIIVVWAIIYDTMYAMVDREDDLKLGLRSTAILFDEADRFIIGVLQLIFFAGLMLLAPMADLGKWYWLGLAGAAIAAIYQQLLIRDRDPASCFRAFLNNNALGASVFAGIALDYLFRSA
ncbi:MAG: 4-hydroxybenzoate octaprenyltransferase, partial [Chromatiales bacterium]|nr:4-hydroxybenzoate octaprenyltransferase [Chromatiales bacterium]